MSDTARNLEGRCGTCAFFVPLTEAEDGSMRGECRLGCWPSPLADTATCANHKAIGTPWQTPKAALSSGTGRRRAEAPRPVRPALPSEIGIDMDQEEFRTVLREVLLDELGVRDTDLGDRWVGGEMVLVPGKDGVQEKRVPLDNLFRKVVLIREKLRVLEQKINGHDKLDDSDRLQLQQYITACYGSLTTFNALFRNKEEGFMGQSGKGE